MKGCSHARGTVNKYLHELIDDEHYINRHRGHTASYYLTNKGVKRAKKLALKHEIDAMTSQEIEVLRDLLVKARQRSYERTKKDVLHLKSLGNIIERLEEGEKERSADYAKRHAK